MRYTSLHNHSEYSNLRMIDSLNKINDLVQYGFDIGLKGLAITDHESLSGHIRAWNYYNEHFTEEEKQQYKLILGNEIYLTRDGLNAENHQKGEKFFHLILIAKDDIGHEQLRELSSRAWNRGYVRNMMRVPTYSSDIFDIFENNKGHVICSTACLGSYCGINYLNGNYEAIKNHLELLSDVFGYDNFYIELQPSKESQDQINYNNYMVNTYYGKYNFICTTDAHYLTESKRQLHKHFLQSSAKDKDREVDAFYSSTFVMSYDELVNYFTTGNKFSIDFINEMCENTNHICDEIVGYNFKQTSIIPHIEFNNIQPSELFYNIAKKYNAEYIQATLDKNDRSDMYLLALLEEPWKRVVSSKEEKDIIRYVKELDYELEQLYFISNELNQSMSNYFITMAKMIDIIWNEGDSIVGPARGSAGSSLINYLLGITQINPLEQPVELPFWRFIHKDRPGLPDIDIDTESTKRNKVFNKVREYFNSIGGDLVHVCTFGTEATNSSIRTAGRGLNVADEVVSYITALIPNERGKDWDLHTCYYGDGKDRKPIQKFVEEMDKNPDLWELAQEIEGIVSKLGCHASGVLALNNAIYKNNGIMKTNSNVIVTAFDLGDTEQMGGVKYDFLTVQALDKIRTCLNLLLEDERITWQGSLKKTYTKYIHPDILNYSDKGMWDSLYNKEIDSCFQFDTPVGGQAIALIHPTSLLELATGNSVMRLMADGDNDLPLNIYAKFKNDINLWYDEIAFLTKEERDVLKKYLDPLYGVADSQEVMMKLAMDEHIANFTIAEANILRKAVAKKKKELLQKGKDLFYEKGTKQGTRQQMLDYVWNVQIMRQAGYSFSVIHTIAYSYIALQEMNLCYFYPSIYWKTACISVDAGAVNEEDYYNLVEEGIIELTDDEDKRDQNKVQYGKIALAISKFQQNNNIGLPDINVAKFGFTPDAERDMIVFGLKGIVKIGDQIINEIILRRPFTSVQDFVDKMVDGTHKLISKDKVVNLIKAGCFDHIENKPREEIMLNFIKSIADQKKRLTLQNMAMLIKYNLLPDSYDFAIRVYNYTKYLRKNKYNTYYILDDIAFDFYCENYGNKMDYIKSVDGHRAIAQSTWDSIYKSLMESGPKAYIKAHEQELLDKLNHILFMEEFNKYAKGDLLQWELDSMNFYYSGHPLSKVFFPFPYDAVNMLKENDYDGCWEIDGKQIPRYHISTIIGTVLDADKNKGIVLLATTSGVINVKLYKMQYAAYSREQTEITEDGEEIVTEESFLKKGTHLLINGILKGDFFIPKVYKKTGMEPLLKIILNNDGTFKQLQCKA